MFRQIRIRNITQEQQAVNLAVYPFSCMEGTRMMYCRGEYNDILSGELSQWKRALADALWDGVPGLNILYFSNGGITLRHNGVCDDAEVIELATAIITPALEQNLALSILGKEED